MRENYVKRKSLYDNNNSISLNTQALWDILKPLVTNAFTLRKWHGCDEEERTLNYWTKSSYRGVISFSRLGPGTGYEILIILTENVRRIGYLTCKTYLNATMPLCLLSVGQHVLYTGGVRTLILVIFGVLSSGAISTWDNNLLKWMECGPFVVVTCGVYMSYLQRQVELLNSPRRLFPPKGSESAFSNTTRRLISVKKARKRLGQSRQGAFSNTRWREGEKW